MADAGVMRGVVLRALGASWGDLGSSWAPLGSLWESFWALLGHLLGLRGRVGSGKDAKVKIIVFLKEFIGFLRPRELQNEVKMRQKRLPGQ